MLTVNIDTRLKVDVGGVHRTLRIKNKNALREIVEQGIATYKKESPVNNGAFRESVKRLDSQGSEDGEGRTERFIRIGPTIYYSKFVIGGTSQSAGRYVPELDVRIRSGVHPGTKPNPIPKRVKKIMQPKIRAILSKHYGTLELGSFINA
jgi:hypothetical protein